MTDAQITPAIDFAHLHHYVGDDASVIAEVFSLFRNQIDMWTRGLDPGAPDDHWTSIMHSLKGSAAAVGGHAISALCARGEQMIADRSSPALRMELKANLEFEIDRALTEIARWEYQQTLARLRT